jgi:hypothetical protein
VSKNKSKKPSRAQKIKALAAEVGTLTAEMYQAHRRYVITHNDKLCGARTPSSTDQRDVLAAKRRWEILVRKCKAAETVLREFVRVPNLLDDPRKTLG